MALSQLLYISDAIRAISLHDLLAIQDVSIRNNARQNITGILFHTEGKFVQFLEGDHNEIRQLFATICTDHRHKNVRLLYQRPSNNRVFADWHMAMLDLELHSEVERINLQELVYQAAHPKHPPGEEPTDLHILYRFRSLLQEA